MIKKYIILTFITLLFYSSVSSAETSSSDKDGVWKTGKDDKLYMKGKNSNLKKATDAIKQAKKYAKKEKFNKAKKRFNDAIKFLILANKENPNEPDILNYLGYSYKKVDDLLMAEIYYEQGLAINPEHIGINEYLGQLYVETNRIDKAKERLKVLKNCNCEGFEELQNLVSKY
jgi:tetratricopeptide (TPR) repeat protein